MLIKKFKKNKGVLIFITGLSGSGKSSIAKKIYPSINKIFGPTILINGDDLRKIFKLYGFTINDRLENSKKFAELFKIITKQNISILFAAVGMKHKTRQIFKKTVNNYFEIYIKANLDIIIKKNKKKIYRQYNSNIVGNDIVAEFPKQPDIILKNDFKLDINKLNQILKKKLNKFRFNFS